MKKTRKNTLSVLVGLFATLPAIGSAQDQCAPPPPSINIDMMPGSCPNTLNIDKKGVFHGAIIGTATFDVSTVTSVTLNGVLPLSSALLDQVSPLGHEPVDCNDCTSGLVPDGHIDLILKFDTKAVAATLGNPAYGACLSLHLTTNLGDTKSDMVRILTSKRP